MERKNEHQGEIKDPRKSTAKFGGRIKNMKEKTHMKTTELKMKEKAREHLQRK